MLTLNQIFSGARRLRDHVNPTNSHELMKVVGLPYLRALAVQLHFQPLTQKDAAYHEVTFVFHDIGFSETRRGNYEFECDVIPGIRAYAQRPSFETSQIQVRCTCDDYYFTWWIHNRHFGSNSGPDMELYTRKTPPPPEGLPFRNPINTVGGCKHILRGARYLVGKGMITYP